MKKVLVSRNSADGVVASLLIQAKFETCDPLFDCETKRFESIGIPLYSAGVKCRKYELYIDNKGPEDGRCVIKPDKTLAEIAFEICPNDRYAHLVSACRDEDFKCFFELYGASSCFGQLRYDPDSWNDGNVQAYKKLQEEIASKVLVSSCGGKAEVFVLPEEAGSLCRNLVFFETDAVMVLFLQKNKFRLKCRHGFEKAFNLRNFAVTEQSGNETAGFCLSKYNPIKLREKLEQAIEKYEEKGEMLR